MAEKMNDVKFNSLEHVGTMVSDLEKSTDFYCEMFGFEVIDKIDIPYKGGILRSNFVQLGDLVLHLEQLPEWDPAWKDGLFHHICIGVDDIHAAIGFLKSKDVKFDMENTFILENLFGGNLECIFLRGPDNELIELCQRC